ncbi:MAG: XylR family transcriptional regulator, partial [Puniceicoccales bacterium]
MSQLTPNRIALLLGMDLGYSRRVLSGILGYAESENLAWVFHHAPPDLRIIPALRRWQPDGIIAHLSELELANRLCALNVPLISVTDTLTDSTFPTVDVDSKAVGRVAAEYFLNRGYRSFAYFGSKNASFSLNRKQGFSDRLKEAGFTPHYLHSDFLPQSPFLENWELEDRNTKQWLVKLPKPVGILASNDIPARTLCDLCRRTHLRVPDDVAILGIDNDLSICRMSRPTLSSVDIPAESIGRTAAQHLQKRIQGKSIP